MKEEQTYVLLRLFVSLEEAHLALVAPRVEVVHGGLRPLADNALLLLRRLISAVLFLLLFVCVYECT